MVYDLRLRRLVSKYRDSRDERLLPTILQVICEEIMIILNELEDLRRRIRRLELELLPEEERERIRKSEEEKLEMLRRLGFI